MNTPAPRAATPVAPAPAMPPAPVDEPTLMLPPKPAPADEPTLMLPPKPAPASTIPTPVPVPVAPVPAPVPRKLEEKRPAPAPKPQPKWLLPAGLGVLAIATAVVVWLFVLPPPPPPQFRLDVERPSNGTIRIGDKECGGTDPAACNLSFPQGQRVELSATPADDYEFAGFTGEGCTGTAPSLSVEITSDIKCVALFRRKATPPPARFTLTVDSTRGGFVEFEGVNCRTNDVQCSKEFDDATQVTLRATADPKYQFDRWSGPCVPADADFKTPTFGVTITHHTSCTAMFSRITASATPTPQQQSGPPPSLPPVEKPPVNLPPTGLAPVPRPRYTLTFARPQFGTVEIHPDRLKCGHLGDRCDLTGEAETLNIQVVPAAGYALAHSTCGQRTNGGITLLLNDTLKCRVTFYRPPPLKPKAKDKWTNTLTASEMVWIAPPSNGSFMMGSPPDEKGRDAATELYRPVSLARGFWLDATEVTNSAYAGLMQTSISGPPNQPVANVTWNEAVAFCRLAGGRLPEDHEWEFAARAGSTARNLWEGRLNLSTRSGHVSSSGKPSDVKTKNSNGNSLFDMFGNVAEWTATAFLNYPYDPANSRSDGRRVVRGGAYDSDEDALRFASRRGVDQTAKDVRIGFRCAYN
jgi:formylglycine-generating enzyme required for sulfatase activity